MCAFCKKLLLAFLKKANRKTEWKTGNLPFYLHFISGLSLACSIPLYLYISAYIHIAVYICSCLNSISKCYPNLCLPCLARPIFSIFSTFIPWLISVFITIFLFHSVASTSATLLSIHFYILPMNNSIYPKPLTS